MKVTFPNGKVVNAEQVEIEDEKLPWTVLKLADGTILRIRINVASVLRLDMTNQADGNPVYKINNQLMIRVTNVPRKLRAKVLDLTKKAEDKGHTGVEVA